MTALPDFQPRALLERLVARGVDFVVIGGFAVIVHGHVRLTRDVDIACATDPGNLEALGSLLVELGATLAGVGSEPPFSPDPQTLRRAEPLTLDTALGRLDVHSRPPGAPPYEALRRNAARYRLDGFFVLVASIEDLLSMKRAAGRATDAADVEALEAIRERAGCL